MRNVCLAMFMLTSYDMGELTITSHGGQTTICSLEDNTQTIIPDDKMTELCHLLEIDLNIEEQLMGAVEILEEQKHLGPQHETYEGIAGEMDSAFSDEQRPLVHKANGF